MAQDDGPRFAEPDNEQSNRAHRREMNAERREDIHIRNYDFRQGYDLELTVINTQTEQTVYDDRFYFQPGQDKSLQNLLDAGIYRVSVQLDDGETKLMTCEIDTFPQGGILIELGNGQVSVTEGIYR